MNDSSILDLTENLVDASIEIRKKYRTKLPDAIIAATALIHGLTVISRNTTDFKTFPVSTHGSYELKQLTLMHI